MLVMPRTLANILIPKTITITRNEVKTVKQKRLSLKTFIKLSRSEKKTALYIKMKWRKEKQQI